MKKFRPFLRMVVLTVTLMFGACDIDDDGDHFYYVPLVVTEVDLPESFDQYEVYNINVTMLRPDDCTFVEGFDVEKQDLTVRDITVVGIQLDRDDCDTLRQEVTETLRFEVLYDQPYLFRFYAGDDHEGNPEYIEVEVPVNPN